MAKAVTKTARGRATGGTARTTAPAMPAALRNGIRAIFRDGQQQAEKLLRDHASAPSRTASRTTASSGTGRGTGAKRAAKKTGARSARAKAT